MREAEIGRLFLVGTPRSGTTLLQCLLAAHSNIVSFPETWYFVEMWPSGRRNRLFRLASWRQQERYRQFLASIPISLSMRLPQRPVTIRQYAGHFTRVLDEFARSEHCTHWLEKTPQHLRHIDLIERYVPGAKFIHLVRNGPDTIASLHDVTRKHPEEWTSCWNLEYCIQHWIDDARITLQHAHRPNHLVLGYRQVVEQTRDVVQRASDFVGLPFEEKMLQEYVGMADKVAPMTDSWRTGVKESIQSRDGTKFNEIFSEAERCHILNRVREVDLGPLRLD